MQEENRAALARDLRARAVVAIGTEIDAVIRRHLAHENGSPMCAYWLIFRSRRSSLEIRALGRLLSRLSELILNFLQRPPADAAIHRRVIRPLCRGLSTLPWEQLPGGAWPFDPGPQHRLRGAVQVAGSVHGDRTLYGPSAWRDLGFTQFSTLSRGPRREIALFPSFPATVPTLVSRSRPARISRSRI